MPQNYNFAKLLSAKEQKEAVKSLCLLEKANEKMYLERLKQINFFKNVGEEINLERPQTKIVRVFDVMKKEHAKIIKDCFLQNKSTSEILENEAMSQTTFYRNRKAAMEEFLYHYVLHT